MFALSLRTRLTLYVSAFMLLLLAVSAVAGWSLIKVQQRTYDLAAKWLTETRQIGELGDSLQEFRLAELSYAAAKKEEAREAAQDELTEHGDIINQSIADLRKLRAKDIAENAEDAELIEMVAATWSDYYFSHLLWIKSAELPDFFDNDVQGRALREKYLKFDASIDALMSSNKRHADAETAEARVLTHNALNVMTIATGFTLFVGLVLILRKQKRVFLPLQQVTEALTRLAAGDRDVPAPAYCGDNEIGALILAFNTFRANLIELERAHEETRLAQEQAEILASQDALTGLANRRVAVAKLHALVAEAREEKLHCGLLIIDLDRFKPINDLMGHAVGDLALCEIAKRLAAAVRKPDVVARLGGDEFAVIVELRRDQPIEDVLQLAERLRETISAPFTWGETELQVGASIGVASTQTLEADAGGLLRAADIAMYRAKRDGDKGVCLFHPAMDAELKDNAYLEEALRRAIVNDRIQPFYQPLVALSDGRIFGFEILSRWRDPHFGEVSPDIFIPIAERLGLIPLLTSFVLRQACRDAADWPEDIQLSLNISALQLKDPGFAEDLLADLARHGFPPRRLEIEITETALIGDIRRASRALDLLRAQGVKVSLDDFGTGYSSLTHLREFKLDKVKIDKRFVQAMQIDEESRRIVIAMLSLVKSLGLSTAVEGVENDATVQLLREAGCPFGQGYYFGRPTSAAGAEALIEGRDAPKPPEEAAEEQIPPSNKEGGGVMAA